MDNSKAREVVDRVIFLHSVFTVKQSLGWFIMNGVVSNEAAQEVDQLFERAVKELLPHMNTCVEALGVPTSKHLIAPIARDYVSFNAQNDNENFEAAGEMFDFRKTGEPRARL